MILNLLFYFENIAAQLTKRSSVSGRHTSHKIISTPEPIYHPASPPPPAVRQAKVKFGTGRARGRGRGRGRGRQSMTDSRSNTIDTSPAPINHFVLSRNPDRHQPEQYRIATHRSYETSSNTIKISLTTSTASSSHNQRMDVDTNSDEEIWCICRRPYEGRDMIECEHKKCPYKWYHLDCIGLTQADVPKGKWYCKVERCKQSRSHAPVTGKRKRQNERLVGHYSH